MATNRIHPFASPKPAAQSPAGPPVPMAVVIPQGFVVCPPHLTVANGWQQEIYRQAYQQALAATQLPWSHRLLFSVWN